MTARWPGDHTFDVVVVGAGGSGLRATLGMRRGGPEDRLHHQGVPDALAHGGGAGRHLRLARQYGPGRLALAHVRHRQGLGLARRPGRDRIHLARNAPAAVYELEHWGVPFSRTEEGKIYQRAFGGMTKNYGEGPPVQRTCAAADRTGHAMLHTLYGQSLREMPSSSSSISRST
jgi:succinate dehydrogenase / fumarate reductase flavoprotein subunit